MIGSHPEWLECLRGTAPLVVSLPHTGTEIPAAVAARLVSPGLSRKDTDWHVERLYDFARGAKGEGFKVIIAGAGGAAHLPGMTAALTTLPVFGVPVESKALSGQDSL